MSALLHPQPPARISLQVALVAGTLSGVLAAVLAPLAVLWLRDGASPGNVQFSTVWIGAVALVSNIVGGAMYYALVRWTHIPRIGLAVFALPIVAVSSMEIGLATSPGFAAGVNPVVLLIALVAVLVLPTLAHKLQARSQRLARQDASMTPLRAEPPPPVIHPTRLDPHHP